MEYIQIANMSTKCSLLLLSFQVAYFSFIALSCAVWFADKFSAALSLPSASAGLIVGFCCTSTSKGFIFCKGRLLCRLPFLPSVPSSFSLTALPISSLSLPLPLTI